MKCRLSFLILKIEFVVMRRITFITDGNGRRISAIIPIRQYQRLLEKSMELEDVRAYDKVMRRKHEFIPLDEAIAELKSAGME